jgi:hypothetical protein
MYRPEDRENEPTFGEAPVAFISQVRNQREVGSKEISASYLFRAGFLLRLFFDYEDRSDMLFRNVGRHSTDDYMALFPRR